VGHSLTECNTGITQKLPFAVNAAIELKNISDTSDSTGTLIIQDTPRRMPVLSDVAIVLNSISSIKIQMGNFGLCQYCLR
jgi:hypothetical protein